jgi:hypothetical protein
LCLGTVSKTSGCCCGGTCCSSSEGRSGQSQMADGQFQTRSCCQHQHRQANDSPGKQQAVGPRGCTRIVAFSEVVLMPSHSKMTVGKDLTLRICLPLHAIAAARLPMVADGVPSWESHQVAPPADLLTTLQRLLI